MTLLNIMCYVIIDLNPDMNIIFDLIYTSAGLFSSIHNWNLLYDMIWDVITLQFLSQQKK